MKSIYYNKKTLEERGAIDSKGVYIDFSYTNYENLDNDLHGAYFIADLKGYGEIYGRISIEDDIILLCNHIHSDYSIGKAEFDWGYEETIEIDFGISSDEDLEEVIKEIRSISTSFEWSISEFTEWQVRNEKYINSQQIHSTIKDNYEIICLTEKSPFPIPDDINGLEAHIQTSDHKYNVRGIIALFNRIIYILHNGVITNLCCTFTGTGSPFYNLSRDITDQYKNAFPISEYQSDRWKFGCFNLNIYKSAIKIQEEQKVSSKSAKTKHTKVEEELIPEFKTFINRHRAITINQNN